MELTPSEHRAPFDAGMERGIPPHALRLPSGRHGLSREAVVSAQRERLMDAVITTVGEKGYANTTVADVIGRAGVSRATFYELFEDKEDCFLAAYEALIDALIRFVSTAYEGGDGWPDQIRAGLEAVLRFLAASPDSARVTMIEVLAATPRAQERYRAAVARFDPFFEGGVRFVGSESTLPDNVAQIAVGGVATIIAEEILTGRAEELPKVLPEAVYVALVPFVGHDRALDEKRKASAS